MKILTLKQPWATLVATGHKMIETRSWQTSYRGLIGIHASASIGRKECILSGQEPFRTALHSNQYFTGLRGAGVCRICGCTEQDCRQCIEDTGKPCTWINEQHDLCSACADDKFFEMPTGELLAIARLERCVIFPDPEQQVLFEGKDKFVPPSPPELNFGDFTPGRYGWIFSTIYELVKPIPMKGALSLWESHIPLEEFTFKKIHTGKLNFQINYGQPFQIK